MAIKLRPNKFLLVVLSSTVRLVAVGGLLPSQASCFKSCAALCRVEPELVAKPLKSGVMEERSVNAELCENRLVDKENMRYLLEAVKLQDAMTLNSAVKQHQVPWLWRNQDVHVLQVEMTTSKVTCHDYNITAMSHPRDVKMFARSLIHQYGLAQEIRVPDWQQSVAHRMVCQERASTMEELGEGIVHDMEQVVDAMINWEQ